MKIFKSMRRDDKGQTLVEFALVIPIILLLFLGMMDFSRLNTADTQVTNATQEAAKEFAHLANIPEYKTAYLEDLDKPSKDRRINQELKRLVAQNVNTVPAENISVDAVRAMSEAGEFGHKATVRVTAHVPSLSQLTFRNVKVEREVTLRIP